MKEIIIQVNDQPLTIKKLPLGNYVDLIKAIKELPKHFDKIKTEKDIIENLPYLLSECAPDIFGIIHVATGLDTAYIENELGMDDLVEIISAVLAVNNYSKIYDKVKKALARPTSTTPITNESLTNGLST